MGKGEWRERERERERERKREREREKERKKERETWEGEITVKKVDHPNFCYQRYHFYNTNTIYQDFEIGDMQASLGTLNKAKNDKVKSVDAVR